MGDGGGGRVSAPDAPDAADAAERVGVLDKGYVRLVGHLGSDLSVVNAARVSFAKESRRFSENDGRLIAYLVKHGHTSPFRHAFLSFEVKAPLFVARQWWKYVVGSAHLDDSVGWNEVSRRYVTEEPEFHVPAETEWRSAPEDAKQGSGAPIEPEWDGRCRTLHLQEVIDIGVQRYKLALKAGVCAEQARLMLPAYALYTTWRWSGSLQMVMHFLDQRLADGAQREIREYALAVRRLVEPLFPATMTALVA